MSDEELMTLAYELADALFPYHDAWDEGGSEAYNVKQRARVNAALDAARRLGWSP